MTFLFPLKELCGYYSAKNVSLSQDSSVRFYSIILMMFAHFHWTLSCGLFRVPSCPIPFPSRTQGRWEGTKLSLRDAAAFISLDIFWCLRCCLSGPHLTFTFLTWDSVLEFSCTAVGRFTCIAFGFVRTYENHSVTMRHCTHVTEKKHIPLSKILSIWWKTGGESNTRASLWQSLWAAQVGSLEPWSGPTKWAIGVSVVGSGFPLTFSGCLCQCHILHPTAADVAQRCTVAVLIGEMPRGRAAPWSHLCSLFLC